MVKNMGTINYYTSDYITIGINPDDFRGDFDDENDDIIYYDDYINDLYDDIDSMLKGENFYYFHVALKPGYYEGFSIDIEFNFGYCLDSWQDRRDVQKEITRIYKFLLKCIEAGLCAVSPGWCTAYYDYNESLQRLKQAVKEMRATVQNAPTWATIRRKEA